MTTKQQPSLAMLYFLFSNIIKYTCSAFFIVSVSASSEPSDAMGFVADKHRTNITLIAKASKHLERNKLDGYSRFFIRLKTPKYGRTFYGGSYPLNLIAYAFWEFIKLQSAAKCINSLEIGCADGAVSAIVPFCHGKKSLHIGVDLSTDAIAKAKTTTKMLLGDELSESCKFVRKDFFEILNTNPMYKGKMTGIFCQNVIHFFSPSKVFEFFTLVEQFLTVGGRAFISADAPYDPELLEQYKLSQAREYQFPGFMKYRTGEKIFKNVGGKDCIRNCAFGISVAKEDDIETHVCTIRNFFTTELFQMIGSAVGLKVVDCGYMNAVGVRLDSSILQPGVQTAFAIFEKSPPEVAAAPKPRPRSCCSRHKYKCSVQ